MDANTEIPITGAMPVGDDASGTPTIDVEVTRLISDGEMGGAPTIAVGRRLADRYRVIRLLGTGGMGVVYQAWDEKLGVAVALKVILQPGAADSQAQAELEHRFKTELLLARQVTHKNVVRIHDMGEVEGIKYITMPCVEGANLAHVLSTGQLTVRRALHFARQIAAGLAAAHEAGVLHRDLKPANIMVDTEERALIMDFGIARSASASAADRSSIAGTLEYMAPEQASRGPVDHRADIFAFGLILREMLTAARRASVTSMSSVDLAAYLAKPLPSVRSIDPEIPEAVEQVVDRCLKVDPAARYEATADLVAALERLDEDGQPLPEPPHVSWRMLVGLSATAIAMIAVAWIVVASRWVTTGTRPAHEPVSVLIADFDNRTRDPVFNGSVEQALTIGVEGASFITTYPHDDAMHIAAQLAPGGRLDEQTARLISIREGVKFVVSGVIEPRGSGYSIAANLIDPAVTDKPLKTVTVSAKTREGVLPAIGTVAAGIRQGLGDTTPASAQRAASETFTTASLEAVREYTTAQDLIISANRGKYEEAIVHYRRAIEADPKFGRAWAGWANSAYQLGRRQEAEKLWKEALPLMDRMSERERYRTLGGYYLSIARNYQKATDNFTTLLELYPADRAGLTNLAYAYFATLDFPKAVDAGRRAAEIYPKNWTARGNYVLYAMYASQFDMAEREARRLLAENPKLSDAYFPVAISQLAAGDRDSARKIYQQMADVDSSAASRATMGLADIAMYEGRYDEAVRILTTGLADDEKTKNSEGLASKNVALAESYQALGRRPQAVAAARKALAVQRLESVVLPVARVFLTSGDAAGAKALSAELNRQLQPQSRAYGKVIEGEIALHEGRIADAVESFQSASRLYNIWLTHFDLGIAYVRAGADHSAEAVSEFDACVKRRGEAAAIFLDDLPSFRYLAPLSYWLGRAQEGVGMRSDALQNYNAYATLRSAAQNDSLIADARQRVASR